MKNFRSGYDIKTSNWIYGKKKHFPDHATDTRHHKTFLESRIRAMASAIRSMNEEDKYRYIVPNVRMVIGRKNNNDYIL